MGLRFIKDIMNLNNYLVVKIVKKDILEIICDLCRKNKNKNHNKKESLANSFQKLILECIKA